MAQRFQLSRIAQDRAPSSGRLFSSPSEARAYAATSAALRLPRPSSPGFTPAPRESRTLPTANFKKVVT